MFACHPAVSRPHCVCLASQHLPKEGSENPVCMTRHRVVCPPYCPVIHMLSQHIFVKYLPYARHSTIRLAAIVPAQGSQSSRKQGKGRVPTGVWGKVWERGGATISKLQPSLAKWNKGFEVAEPEVLEADVRQCEEPGKRMVGRQERKVASLMKGFGVKPGVLALSGDLSKGLGPGCAMIRDIFTK